jgi:hypothetical protein
MAQRVRPVKTTLEVRVMYEPNRLAAAYLADAYARVVPIRWRPVDARSRPSGLPPAPWPQPAGRTAR